MEILLVGTIHLGETPDIHTLAEDDKKKYNDVHFKQLAADIAKFQSDQVFVEYPFELQKQLNAIYRSAEVNEDFKENEVYQIGFRLAKMLGHDAIYAVDWHEEPDESINLGLVAEGKSKAEYEKIMDRIKIDSYVRLHIKSQLVLLDKSEQR